MHASLGILAGRLRLGRLAVMRGASLAETPQRATRCMIADLLVIALMWAWRVEYAATALYYWHDRR